jgi:MFS family permease
MGGDAPPPSFRRNFTLGVLNGVLFVVGMNLVSSSLVLPGLVRDLGGSHTLVGALPSFEQGGWLLPQLLVGTRIQSWARKLPVYRVAGIIRVFLFISLAAVIALAGRMSPAVALSAFFVLYGLYALSAGVCGIPFQDVVAKAIPARRRGTFFGLRRFLGGLLVLLAVSPAVGVVLGEGSPWSFPQNYALLYGVALVFVVGGLTSFSLVVEPPSKEVGRSGTLRNQLRLLPAMWRAQPNLRRFLAFRVLSRLGLMVEPFYIVYATEVLGASRTAIGGYMAAVTVVQLLSYALWSWMSDRRGNRLLMRVGSGLSVAAPLMALLLPLLANAAALSPLGTAYLFALVFAVNGLGRASLDIGAFNYVLELLAERDRPTALGLINTITGIASLLIILAGGLADRAGYPPLFLLAGLTALGGYLVTRFLPEPRCGQPRDREQAAEPCSHTTS